jgi:Domain of unknown function (DUF1816)
MRTGTLNMTLSMTLTKHDCNDKPSDLCWWLEVRTINPICIYFFGPFENQSEAESSQEGFVQDLEAEKAWVLYSNVKLHNPSQLTIDATDLSIDDLRFFPNDILPNLAKS